MAYICKLDLNAATPEQVAGELNTITAEGESLQWAKRQLIADLSDGRNWTADQLKDGDAAKFLDAAVKSVTQASELRSYALPEVRKQVGDIRTRCETLKSSDKNFEKARVGNMANAVVTQLKKGKTIAASVKIVAESQAKKTAQTKLEGEDAAAWLKTKLKALEGQLKSRFEEEGVATAMGALKAMKIKPPKVEEPVADVTPTAETPAPAFDLGAELAKIEAMPIAQPSKDAAIAALIAKS